MLAPDAEANQAHTAKGKNNKAFLPNRFAGKSGNEVGNDAEAREHGNVDLGLCEKPEEALPERGESVGRNVRRLSGEKIHR